MIYPNIRKTFSGLALAGALLATPVLADTYTNGSWGTGEDGKTEVAYTVAPTYTVVIPSSLTLSTDTYTGATNNVFIKSDSRIVPTEKVTVSLPVQDFIAKDSTNASTIPFTVRYTTKLGAVAGTATAVTSISGSAVTLLEQTGAQIGATAAEDGASPTTGQAAISATVEATVTAAQAAQADVSGNHTGYITFSVAKA